MATPHRKLYPVERLFTPAPKQLIRHAAGALYRITGIVIDDFGATVHYENREGREFTLPMTEFYDEVQFYAPVDLWMPRFVLLAENVSAAVFRQIRDH